MTNGYIVNPSFKRRGSKRRERRQSRAEKDTTCSSKQCTSIVFTFCIPAQSRERSQATTMTTPSSLKRRLQRPACTRKRQGRARMSAGVREGQTNRQQKEKASEAKTKPSAVPSGNSILCGTLQATPFYHPAPSAASTWSTYSTCRSPTA